MTLRKSPKAVTKLSIVCEYYREIQSQSQMVELLCHLESGTSVEGPDDSSPEALMTSGSVEKKA